MVQQVLGFNANHLAKRRVDVGDASFQVARAQAGDQRVFHGFPESQCVGQVMLHAQSPANVTAQQQQHRNQRHRQAADQRSQHVGEKVRRAFPAVHAQHQGGTRQVQHLLRVVKPVAPHGCAGDGQARAVGFCERQALPARELRAGQLLQNFLQRVGGQGVTRQPAFHHERQAHVDQFEPQAVELRCEVTAGVGRHADPHRGVAGLGDFKINRFTAHTLKHRGAVGRFVEQA